MDWETRAFKCKVNFENLTGYSAESAPSTSALSKKPQEHKAKSSPSLALPKPQTSLAAQKPNTSKPHAQSFELQKAQATTLTSTDPHKCNILQEFCWIQDTQNLSNGWKVPMELLYAQGYSKRRAQPNL